MHVCPECGAWFEYDPYLDGNCADCDADAAQDQMDQLEDEEEDANDDE